MDISPEAIKGRVGAALKAAHISLRQFAIDEGLDRDSVREWVNTNRTMPVEFVALVAARTGESGHYLLTGNRGTKAERRQEWVQAVMDGLLDDVAVADVKGEDNVVQFRKPAKRSRKSVDPRLYKKGERSGAGANKDGEDR